MYIVAISQAQVDMAPRLPWRRVVHNALDVTGIPCQQDKGDHLVWLGRMSPDKAAHVAIDLARAAGRRILLAGKVSEPDEKDYFDREVRPRLGDDGLPGVAGATCSRPSRALPAIRVRNRSVRPRVPGTRPASGVRRW